MHYAFMHYAKKKNGRRLLCVLWVEIHFRHLKIGLAINCVRRQALVVVLVVAAVFYCVTHSYFSLFWINHYFSRERPFHRSNSLARLPDTNFYFHSSHSFTRLIPGTGKMERIPYKYYHCNPRGLNEQVEFASREVKSLKSCEYKKGTHVNSNF